MQTMNTFHTYNTGQRTIKLVSIVINIRLSKTVLSTAVSWKIVADFA